MKSRFAPSPTGYLHIGSVRTALFAWIWVKKQKGAFILRIEDTDQQRSTQQSVDAILEGMAWLGLDYDAGPYYQTQRFERYQAVIQQLLDADKAYYCACSPERLQTLREGLIAKGEKSKYDGHCAHKNLTTGAVRFRTPTRGNMDFMDLVKGKISVNNKELDDLIIARSNGLPTYNLTVVIDDHDMGIDCVIRGDDHINNTPRQINLYHALGWNLPEFAHLPMILGSDGTRLSKRHSAVNVMAYRDAGFLPEALLNYLVRLGWSHGDQELFSIDEMIALFELKDVNKAPASFNPDKLLWINQEHIKQSNIDNLRSNLAWHLQKMQIKITPTPDINAVIKHLQERCKTLSEMASGVKMFYQDFAEFDPQLAKKHFKNKAPLISLQKKLTHLNHWQADKIKLIIKEVCTELNIGFGKVGQPLRLTLSGDGNAGAIDEVATLVGKTKTLNRLNKAINFQRF